MANRDLLLEVANHVTGIQGLTINQHQLQLLDAGLTAPKPPAGQKPPPTWPLDFTIHTYAKDLINYDNLTFSLGMNPSINKVIFFFPTFPEIRWSLTGGDYDHQLRRFRDNGAGVHIYWNDWYAYRQKMSWSSDLKGLQKALDKAIKKYRNKCERDRPARERAVRESEEAMANVRSGMPVDRYSGRLIGIVRPGNLAVV